MTNWSGVGGMRLVVGCCNVEVGGMGDGVEAVDERMGCDGD